MKKKLTALLSAALVLCFVAGCTSQDSGSSVESSGEDVSTASSSENDSVSSESASAVANTTFGIEPLAEKTTIDVAYFSGAEHALVFYIMDEKGWADELNIEFTWTYFNAGPAMMEANASWDVGTAGAAGCINGIVGYDVNVIGISQYEHILHGFVRPDSAIAEAGKGNVEEAPNIYGTAETLKGTNWLIPMGTTAQQTLGLYLEYFGLTTDDVTMTNMDVGSALAAFRAGEGDGIINWTATDISAQEEGYTIAVSCDDVSGVYSCGLLASDHGLEEKYDAIVTLYELYYRVEDWMMENVDEMAQYYYEACETEGIVCSESGAEYTAEMYEGLGYENALERMTTMMDDPQGLADRQISGGEYDILDTMDFQISVGSYTNEQREAVLDNNRINSTIAEAVIAKNS